MDKERILSKFKEMDEYLDELGKIEIKNFDNYVRSIEKRRTVERLMQILVECVLDICNIVYSGLRVGMPFNEEEVFLKIREKGIISNEMGDVLIGMKGFRNILVHKYGKVSDKIVFKMFKEKVGDFEKFRKEILGKV